MGQIKVSKEDNKVCSEKIDNKMYFFFHANAVPLFLYRDSMSCFSLNYNSIMQGKLSKNFIYLLIQSFVLQKILLFLRLLHISIVECLYGYCCVVVMSSRVGLKQ